MPTDDDDDEVIIIRRSQINPRGQPPVAVARLQSAQAQVKAGASLTWWQKLALLPAFFRGMGREP